MSGSGVPEHARLARSQQRSPLHAVPAHMTGFSGGHAPRLLPRAAQQPQLSVVSHSLPFVHSIMLLVPDVGQYGLEPAAVVGVNVVVVTTVVVAGALTTCEFKRTEYVYLRLAK